MIKAYLCTPHTNLFCRKGNVTLREIMLVAQGRTEENLKDRIWMGSEFPATVLTPALYKMYLIFIMNELTLKISDPHPGSLSQALFLHSSISYHIATETSLPSSNYTPYPCGN